MKTSTLTILVLVSANFASSLPPAVDLKQGAVPGLKMPVMGIGSGGYGTWNDTISYNSILEWLKVANGEYVRIDTSHSYRDEPGIGKALKDSGVPRENFFVTSKIGPYLSLGYQDALDQYETIVSDLQGSPPDLLLIHWPSFGDSPSTAYSNSTDPYCDKSSPTRNTTLCRQSTWRALEDLFKAGKVKAIGVSNFGVNHLEDILANATVLPAVNQIELHPYWMSMDVISFCNNHNIVVNGYCPLGAPMEVTRTKKWPHTLLQDETILSIANKHSTFPSNILLAYEWSYKILMNPRSMNKTHMVENLNFNSVSLSASDIDAIDKLRPTTLKLPH